MNNVIPFRPRPKPATIVKETKWDQAYAEGGEDPEYRLSGILLAMSWAYQTGRIKVGDKLLVACRMSSFSPWIQLGKELGDAMEEADMGIAMRGTPEQQEDAQ